MKNELTIDLQSILVRPGSIAFNDFSNLKKQALALSEQISQVEVTEDNVKHSKKLLAAVNNRVKEIEDHRIAVKKQMLEPYVEFEKQVKEIVGIVKEADSIVRDQVRSLEEMEREAKKDEIEILFLKRKPLYTYSPFMSFADFLKPQHLNKTTSMKSIESDMIDFMEKIENDIGVIRTLPNHEKVMTEYLDTKDVATAIRIVNEYEERLQAVKQVDFEDSETSHNAYVITVFDMKDLRLLELFMEQNQIRYEKVVK